MYKKIFVFSISIAILHSALQAAGNLKNACKPASHIVQQTDLKNFEGVVAAGPIDVIVTLGEKQSVRFEGDAEAIESLVAEVQGKVLVVRPKASVKSWAKKYEDKKIVAYITAKTITSLTISGNATLTVKGKVHAAELATNISGSGWLKADVDADAVTATISGSGDIRLSGAVGDLNARISGSGSVHAHVNNTIKALISGSGNVYYSGNPSIEEKVIGSGGVREAKNKS